MLALLFILGFATAAGVKAIVEGRGLTGFIMTASGADVAVRLALSIPAELPLDNSACSFRLYLLADSGISHSLSNIQLSGHIFSCNQTAIMAPPA